MTTNVAGLAQAVPLMSAAILVPLNVPLLSHHCVPFPEI